MRSWDTIAKFLTNKKSPTNKVFFIEPEGITKACIKKKITKRTITTVPVQDCEIYIISLKFP